jgi:hypothetical protein
LFRLQSFARDRGDGVDHDSVGSAVVFPHTNQSVPRCIHNSIRISALGSLTNRPWHLVLILPVQLLVVEIGKKNGSMIDKNRSATILVNLRPRVEGRGRYIMGRTILYISYDYVAPFLLGAALNPIDILAVEENVDQSDGISRD